MRHRHIEYTPGTRIEDLPSAAIVDLLERGDLCDWQPIAAAVARDPEGAFAERVLRLIDAFPMYGTSPLWRSWIGRCRDRAGESARLSPPIGLSALRKRRGLTQVELARRIGMSQSDLSKLERRRDVRLSSLTAFMEGLGGRLGILFLASGGRTAVRIPAEPSEDRPQGRRK